jgi:hypothetical protein
VLYADEEGTAISTQSMLKTFRRCPKQADYKYVQRLKPRVLGRPLRVGKWMHYLQEAYYKGEDWREVHQRLSKDFHELFDEEKEELGDLPRDCYRMMKSYIWHYANDPWKIVDVEVMLETTFPDGTIYRLRADLLIENEFGLWLVDHKWMKTFPDESFRMMDVQSALYIWAALKNKIPVQGFIWNYAKSKAPTVPTLIQSGARISRWNTMDTDFPTAMTFLKKHPELSLEPYKPKLRRLKAERYQHGVISNSSFFQRRVFEKKPEVLKKMATEAFHTSKRMHEYFPTKNPDAVERVPGRSCRFDCSYTDLCQVELLGGNHVQIRRTRYTVGDPMEYYFDDKVGLND